MGGGRGVKGAGERGRGPAEDVVGGGERGGAFRVRHSPSRCAFDLPDTLTFLYGYGFRP